MSVRAPSVGPTVPPDSHPPVDRWGAFCQLYVLMLAGTAVAVSSRFRAFLDEKFRLDAVFIEATLRMPDASLDPDDPFRNIALVYRVLGLGATPNVAAMVAIAVFGVAVFAAVRWSELARLTPVGLATITLCYPLALIYLAQYSKEFVSLVLVAIVLLLPRGRWSEIAIVAAMIGYAVTIRPYWGLVVGLYLVGRILLPRVRGLIPVLALVLATYGALQVVFNVVLGESLSFSRVAVNTMRGDMNISVGSLIVDFLPDQVALQWLNAFLVFLSLIAPWPLVLGGSSTYLAMAAVLCFLWGLTGWSIIRLQRERATARGRRFLLPTGTAPLHERSPRPERAVALLLALVVVQAIFEPDYGSYVKHVVPVLPFFLALLPLKPRSRPGTATAWRAGSRPVRSANGGAS